jgi:hypothetical protein
MLGAQPGEGCLSAVVRATEGYSGSDLTEVWSLGGALGRLTAAHACAAALPH